MLSTASYEARKYGVRSAMPGFIAKQLCPGLIIVPNHFDKYREASTITREVFALFDPRFKAYSLDEASLYLTPYLSKHPEETPEQVAEQLRSLVKERTQLTCSIGIAPNRKLAKICCDVNKPDGQFVLQPDRDTIVNFLKDLPVRKISGIGKVTEQMLKGLGITKCAHIHEKRAILYRLFKPSSAEFFLRSSLGIWSETPKNASSPSAPKSVSKMHTFRPSGSHEFLLFQAREVAQSLAESVQKKHLAGKNIAVYLKTDEFKMFSRSSMLNRFINSFDDILAEATKLLEKEFPITLRQLGIRLSHFRSDTAHQRSISTFLRASPSSSSSSIPSATSPTSPLKEPSPSNLSFISSSQSSTRPRASSFSCANDHLDEGVQLFPSSATTPSERKRPLSCTGVLSTGDQAIDATIQEESKGGKTTPTSPTGKKQPRLGLEERPKNKRRKSEGSTSKSPRSVDNSQRKLTSFFWGGK